MILDILWEVHLLRERDVHVEFVWIPGHMGLRGNEWADSLARRASNLGLPWEEGIPPQDGYRRLQLDVHRRWTEWWLEETVVRGKTYRAIQPLPPVVPWFCSWKNSRSALTTLIRLRLGHSTLPAHLHRIRLRDTPYCECDNQSVGDANHYLFECPRYRVPQQVFWNVLLARAVPLPTALLPLLASFDQVVYTSLSRFFSMSELRL